MKHINKKTIIIIITLLFIIFIFLRIIDKEIYVSCSVASKRNEFGTVDPGGLMPVYYTITRLGLIYRGDNKGEKEEFKGIIFLIDLLRLKADSNNKELVYKVLHLDKEKFNIIILEN